MPVEGTPTILLSNGELIGGYVPAARLIERLNGMMADRVAGR
ncbi:MAG: hypothetical protein ACJ0US_06775 [Arenicellales bacterium]